MFRSIKVAYNHIRNNPVRAFLATTGQPYLPDIPGISVGSPILDNALTVIGEGRADYSLGINMLFTAPELNPWFALMK